MCICVHAYSCTGSSQTLKQHFWLQHKLDQVVPRRWLFTIGSLQGPEQLLVYLPLRVICFKWPETLGFKLIHSKLYWSDLQPEVFAIMVLSGK